MENICLYVKNDYLYSNENTRILPLDSAADTNWYKKLWQAPSNRWYTPLDFADQPSREQSFFSCMRVIYDPDTLTTPLAVLRVDLSKSMLEQALNRTAITQNGFMLLLSGENTVLSSENGAGQNLPEDIGASLSQSAQDTWNTIELDGIPCYKMCIRDRNTVTVSSPFLVYPISCMGLIFSRRFTVSFCQNLSLIHIFFCIRYELWNVDGDVIWRERKTIPALKSSVQINYLPGVTPKHLRNICV